MFKWLIICFCLLQSAEAALTLFANPVNRTVKLSGTDNGTPQTNFGTNPEGATIEIGQVRWELTGVGGPGFGSDSSSSISFDEDVFLTVGPAEHQEVTLFSSVNSSEEGTISLRLFIDDPNFLNIAGKDTYQSVHVIPDHLFVRFVNAHGQIMLPVTGSNFSPINVVVVPEPSSSTILTIGMAGLLLRRANPKGFGHITP